MDESKVDTTEPRPGYLRRNRVAIVVVIAFAVIGAFLGSLIAPGIPSWRSTLAGAMIGAFSGGAAVLNRLLD